MKNDKILFFLRDIEKSLNKILKYTESMVYQDFVSDDKTKDAVERNFEIIGEAVKNLPLDYRDRNLHIPFKQIAGMRDKLIHDYFGVDYEILWTTIKNRLPQFKFDVENLIQQELAN